MKCSTCGIESNDLRAYAQLAPASVPRDAVQLCPACRLQNSLHPRYAALPAAVRADNAIAALGTVRPGSEALAAQ
jgi:hypothetical protein